MSEHGEHADSGVEFHQNRAEQLDQISQADSLIDRGVDDVLDEGYTVPDRWSPAQGFGSTLEEMKRGETIEQRMKQETPENPDRLSGVWNPVKEPRQVGTMRAGRLVSGDNGPVSSEGRDVGIDGAGASAEEAAMHIIADHELARQGLDHDDLDG